MSATILKSAGQHPLLDGGLFRGNVGDLDLVRAALVTNVASRLSSGESYTEIKDWLRHAQLFTYRPTDTDLESLVSLVYGRLEHRNLWSKWTDVHPEMSGTRIWELEELSSCLLEYWTARRSTHVPQPQLRHELSSLWGLKVPELIEAWSALPADPFAHFVDFFDLLASEEAIVGNLASHCWMHKVARKEIDRWMDDLPWDGIALRHLLSFSREIRRLRSALVVLEHYMNSSSTPDPIRSAGERVRELLSVQKQSYQQVMSGLTAHEVFLLADRNDDQVFLDQCAIAYAANHRENVRRDACETTTGMWGTIPWRVVFVQGEDQVRAAREFIDWKVYEVTIHASDSVSSPMEVFLHAPPLAASRVPTSFTFSPRRAHELCQLLLFTKVGGVVMEFMELRWDEELGGDVSVPLGTVRLPLDAEVVDAIVPWLCAKLRSLLPEGPLAEGEHLSFAWRSKGPLVGLISEPEHLDPWG
ncbi:hypothetical protein [Nocardiopsis tropica]|uniref:Uncharacterized protein n=1 Tax=Nocardiopsis tropica TaxID=109330 RepID=A0ABV2A1H9_9ACTN